MKTLHILFLSLLISVSTYAQSINRPQTPAEPYSYTSELFHFDNSEVGITLEGTLTLPKGDGPFPAAILISGSGPTDRDENLFDHKIFHVIADYLTQQGIAVLRYDDRGVGKSGGNHYIANTMDLANDTNAAFWALAKHSKIDSNHIGLIGHSEGGMIAPIVASTIPSIDYIVLLAGPGIPIQDLMVLQNRKVFESLGLPQSALDENENFNRSLYSVLNTEQTISELYDTLLPMIHSYYESIPEEYRELFSPTKEVYYMALVGTLSSPWFNYFLQFDPTPYLEKTNCPLLAVNGEKDIQVISTQNLSGIEEALKRSGHKDFSVKEFSGLNHLFQPCETCTVAEYAEIEVTFSEEVLKYVSDWVLDKIH